MSVVLCVESFAALLMTLVASTKMKNSASYDFLRCELQTKLEQNLVTSFLDGDEQQRRNFEDFL